MKSLFESLKPGQKDWNTAKLIDPDRLPRHIAIIMDGNGRWARRRGLPRVAGHKAGIDAVRSTVETCARLGLGALTLYAFSTENWKRPHSEVEMLWRLLHTYIRRELPTLMEHNIRMRAIGLLAGLPGSVREDLTGAMHETEGNSGMVVNLAINYSGRAEIVQAVNQVMEEARLKGTEPILEITEAAISSRLYTTGLPDLDLMIRTSGEMRISNFLLWQVAYAELYVTETLWPDFRCGNLLDAVLAFQKRERRYGGLDESSGVPRNAGEQVAEALGTPSR